MSMVWSLGFMSGTSLDGVDAAVLRTDGVEIEAFGATAFRPYAREERAALQSALALASGLTADEAAAKSWSTASRVVVKAHREAAMMLDLTQVELVGFHGQTLIHRPDKGVTLQIGDAAMLAKALKKPTIHQFRLEDVAAGGQGAPLAPFYHFALARRAGLTGRVAFLNLGGVGNVTFADLSKESPEEDGALMAFDTGPANAPIDDFVRLRTGKAFDAQGAIAASGAADEDVIHSWLRQSSYLKRAAPKSLDRNDFSHIHADLGAMELEEGAATLTGFVAACVAEAAQMAPAPPAQWLVCGGGRKNAAVMQALRDRLAEPVAPVEAIGVDGDFVEAQAFAYLAVRSARHLPISAPNVTGVATPMTGGQLEDPRKIIP